MKTIERRRLKENEVASIIDQTLAVMGTNKQGALATLLIVLLVGAGIGGYFFWRARTDARVGILLGEAMTTMDAEVAPPPAPGESATAGSYPTENARLEAALTKFLAAAERYPRTAGGILARYQAAGLLALLDRPADAAKRFQEVMDLAGQGSIYYEMARLGKVNAQAQASRFDEAISTFRDLSNNKDGAVPPDAILMQLGRVYLMAGKTTEARQTFRRLLDEYPQSQFATDARREFDQLSLTG